MTAGDQFGMQCLFHRARLTGKQCFVCLRLAFDQFTICRKCLARQNTQHVALPDAPAGYPLEATVRHLALNAFRQASHQVIECTGRLVAQARFQPAAGQQEKYEHGDRVEIDFFCPPALRPESRNRTDNEHDDDAERNRQIHADLLMADIAPGIFKERPAGEQHDRQRQHPGGPAQKMEDVRRHVARLGNIDRSRIHHDLHHAEAGDQPAPECQTLHLFPAGQGICIRCRHGAVAGTIDCRHPIRRPGLACRPLDCGTAGDAIDFCLQHSRHGLQGTLDGIGTGGAMHAFNYQMRIPQ